MPAVSEASTITPVALLFGNAESCAHLRKTILDLGADLVFAENIEELEPEALAASGAAVVIVSLDDAVDERFEEVDSLLEGGSWRVVYDDPESSAALSGWEHARWLRHLRAKLHDQADVDPPRPESARPVEVDPHRTAKTAGSNVSVLPMRSGSGDIDAAPPADSADEQAGADAPAAEDSAWMAEALGLLQSAQGETRADDDAAEGAAEPGEVEAPASNIDHAEQDEEAAAQDMAATAATLDSVDLESASGDADELSLDLALENSVEDLGLDEILAEEANDDSSLGDAQGGSMDFESGLVDAEQQPNSGQGASELPEEADYLSLNLDAQGDIQAAPGAAKAPGDEDWLAQFHGQSDSADVALTIGDIEAGAPAAESAHDAAEPAAQDAASPAGLDAELEPAAEASPALAELDGDLNLDFEQLQDVAETSDFEEPATVEKPSASESAEAAPTEPAPTDSPPQDSDEEQDGFKSVAIDSSQWSLVDYAELDEISEREDESPAEATEASDATETPDRSGPSEFGFELVDPSEYLAPEAPVDRGEELFSAPELMSMQEALAPVVDSDSDQESAAAGGADAAASAKQNRQPLSRLVVLGASIGGPDAVREFLAALPARFPAAFVLAQHLGGEFVDLMIGQLAKSSALPVRQPANAETAVAGEVLVVPKGKQLRLARDGEIQLHGLPDDAAHDPSINLTLNMAAETFGADTIAIVFSGMGNDAVSGALDVAAAGGEVWAQDPEQCVVGAMVEAVAEAGVIKYTGAPADLAQRLIEKFGGESAA